MKPQNGYRRFVRVASLLAIGWSLIQLYAAIAGRPDVMLFRPLHVLLAVALVFAAMPVLRRYSGEDHDDESDAEERGTDEDAPPKPPAPVWTRIIDHFCVAASLAAIAYYVLHASRLAERVTFVDEVLVSDVFVGLLILVLILEACRRVVGPSLPILALIFLAYQFWGNHLSGVLRHRGVDLEQFIDLQLLTPQGLFGVPVGISADYVFYFILFAAFLQVSGGGKFFIDLALALTGRARGGPAKASVVGSALMGSINGSAVANVVSTGVFTIPLMRRTGYSRTFAAAVEAMASSAGQILPPIMGAGAFIMAQTIGWPYQEVAFAAIIPALLFFVAGYFMVDLQARRLGITRLDKSYRVGFDEVTNRIHLLIPLVFLVYMILSGRSLMLSATWAIGLALATSYLRRATWVAPTGILQALESGARRAVSVALPCAVAGIIVGVITQTNLGLRFTGLILTLSGGELFTALFLVMLGSIVLGLGMPTTSAYIMSAVLMTPALVELGVQPIAAHMFVFYFACMSMLTPPVALASFAAAGIAGSSLNKTSLTAFRISLAAFLIPFAFVYGPGLLLQGDPMEIAVSTATAIISTYALAVAIIGYNGARIGVVERVVFFALSLLLLFSPHPVIGGVAVLALVVLVAARPLRDRRRTNDVGEDGSSPEPTLHDTNSMSKPPVVLEHEEQK